MDVAAGAEATRGVGEGWVSIFKQFGGKKKGIFLCVCRICDFVQVLQLKIGICNFYALNFLCANSCKAIIITNRLQSLLA